MTLQEYKQTLRKCAHIIDANWNPTDLQLKQIQSEINKYARSGQKISVGILQQVITSVCGPVTFATFESVDNSDLNTLLGLATSSSKAQSK